MAKAKKPKEKVAVPKKTEAENVTTNGFKRTMQAFTHDEDGVVKWMDIGEWQNSQNEADGKNVDGADSDASDAESAPAAENNKQFPAA